MPILTDEKYGFVSSAAPADEFSVVEFTGVEGLSRPYEFDILLASTNPMVDIARVLRARATFTIHRPDGDDVVFHGLPVKFKQMHSFKDYVFYRLALAPGFQRLALTFHNQIFLDVSLPEILEAVFKDGGLLQDDFELRLQQDYPTWDYVCQYDESHLNFASRWMERDGLYYYFEQGESKEKLIVTDSVLAHVDMPHGGVIQYSPPSGLDAGRRDEVIEAVSWRRSMLPREVVLRDYNYLKPSLELTASAVVKPKGRGRVYSYGEHFRTPAEGKKLAAIRAEELLCRETVISGGGMVPFIRPGYTFSLKNHFKDDVNRKYLTVLVRHQGSQAAYLTSELKQSLRGKENRLFYRNEFEAVDVERQYRPLRHTPKPRFHGTMNAVIDAEGSGEYAELDEHGRYKVIASFDVSGRHGGKASTWLRMVQPYGGQGHGMHFPLRKGTEVLLTFIDGDLDRPVIAGAVPNPETPSPVKAENQTMSALTTASGNKIHIEDQEGSKRILMHTPTANSFARIGAPNDPDHDPKWGDKVKWETMEKEKDGIKLATTQGFDVSVETSNTITLGESTSTIGGLEIKTCLAAAVNFMLGHAMDITLVAATDAKVAAEWKFDSWMAEMEGDKVKVEEETVEASTLEKIVRGQLSKMQAQVEKAQGSVTKAKGRVDKAIGEANDAKGDLEDVTAECNQARGELNEAVANAERVAADVNEAIGNVNYARAELTESVGAAAVVAGELTEAAADFESAVAEKFRANGIDSTL